MSEAAHLLTSLARATVVPASPSKLVTQLGSNTVADVDEIELETGTRHELIDGQMIAMAGGTRAHSAVGLHILVELSNQLRGRPCRPSGSDLGLRAADQLFYPDGMVVCPPLLIDDGDTKTVRNPRVIIEVLSPSTADVDRGKKWFHYQRIESLTDYVMVSIDGGYMEHFWRSSSEPNVWRYESVPTGGTVRLQSIDCVLDVSDCLAAATFWDSHEQEPLLTPAP